MQAIKSKQQDVQFLLAKFYLKDKLSTHFFNMRILIHFLLLVEIQIQI